MSGTSSIRNDVHSGKVTARFSPGSADNYIFDVYNGSIKIGNGTDEDTIKVTYGDGQEKNNIPQDTQITITGSYYSDSNSGGDVVYVAPGVTIGVKLINADISVSDDSRCAFNIDGANVTLELFGDNILKSGREKADLRVSENASLTITGKGSLAATGGGRFGAAIGSNFNESCGAIAINGGVITAQSESWYDIGPGDRYYGNETKGGTFTMNGNAIVFTGRIFDESPKTNGILFIGNNGIMHGNVTIEQGVTFANGRNLTIDSGALTVASGITLTNNGTIATKNGGAVISGGEGASLD